MVNVFVDFVTSVTSRQWCAVAAFFGGEEAKAFDDLGQLGCVRCVFTTEGCL